MATTVPFKVSVTRPSPAVTSPENCTSMTELAGPPLAGVIANAAKVVESAGAI